MNGITKKAAVALTALIGVVALGVGLGSLLPQAAGQLPDKPQVIAKGDGESPQPGTVSGRVLGTDGQPLAGAKLSLLADRDQTVDLGVTDADGRFQVELPVGKKAIYLVVRAEGVGLDFVHLERTDLTKDLEMRAVKDNPIRGRILDMQGRPVAEATVSVTLVSTFANDSLDAFLAEWKKRNLGSSSPDGLKNLWREAECFVVVTTDADGRFTVHGVGAERVVGVSVRKAGLAKLGFTVANRAGLDPKPYNDAAASITPPVLEPMLRPSLLYGPEITAVAEAEKPIRGIIKDAATGKPQPGAQVRLTHEGTSFVPNPLRAVADAEGRFELRGARKAKSYTLEVAADHQAGYLPGQAQVIDTAGYELVVADITVKKGVVITGRVIDAATKKALPGFARVGVLADNKFVNDYPGFGSAAWYDNCHTDADGTFRAVTIPGLVVLMGGPGHRPLQAEGILRFQYKPPAPDPAYAGSFDTKLGHVAFAVPRGGFAMVQGNSCKVLEIKPGTQVVKQDIVVEPANALTVKVQDAAGQPLEGCWFTGIGSQDHFPPIQMEKDVCTAYNLEPGKKRLMVFHEPAKNLFGTLTLTGRETDEAVVKLGPGATVKGRLVDDQGRPLAGVPVNVKHRDRTAAEMQVHTLKGRTVETDADGRFQIDGTVPGTKFTLEVGRGQKAFDLVEKAEDHAVQAGGTADLGDVKVKPRPRLNGE